MVEIPKNDPHRKNTILGIDGNGLICSSHYEILRGNSLCLWNCYDRSSWNNPGLYLLQVLLNRTANGILIRFIFDDFLYKTYPIKFNFTLIRLA